MTELSRQILPTKTNEPDFYLPVVVSLRDTYDYLEALLNNLQVIEGIDLTIVIDAMLQDIFFNKEVSFGRYIGSLGAYQIQLPESVKINEFETERAIKEAEQHLRGVLGNLFPNMTVENSFYLFKYPGGEKQTNLYVYVPVNSNTYLNEYRSKLLPAQAVRSCIGTQ